MAQEKRVRKEYKYRKTCCFCRREFQTDHDEFQCCYDCFRLYRQFGGIKDYNEFLEAFELEDCAESKDKYIQFVDNVKKFLEIKGDWRVDAILEDPQKFLDKVKIGEKRNKKS